MQRVIAPTFFPLILNAVMSTGAAKDQTGSISHWIFDPSSSIKNHYIHELIGSSLRRTIILSINDRRSSSPGWETASPCARGLSRPIIIENSEVGRGLILNQFDANFMNLDALHPVTEAEPF